MSWLFILLMLPLDFAVRLNVCRSLCN